MSKVVIIGSGSVGSAIAFALTYTKAVDEIILIDVNTKLARGEAMDIGRGIEKEFPTVISPGNYSDCADSDVIIITAGINRRADQSRKDLLYANREIMDHILDEVKRYYNESFVIIVSNPVDLLTEFALNKKVIPQDHLCGTGCLLDTSRWKYELGRYLKVGTDRITAYAVGEHGSGQRMMWNLAKVDDIPIREFCKKNKIRFDQSVIDRLSERVTCMGEQIIARKGKTQYGIAAVTAYLVQRVITGEKTLLPLSTSIGFADGHVESRLVYVENQRIRLWEEEG